MYQRNPITQEINVQKKMESSNRQSVSKGNISMCDTNAEKNKLQL